MQLNCTERLIYSSFSKKTRLREGFVPSSDYTGERGCRQDKSCTHASGQLRTEIDRKNVNGLNENQKKRYSLWDIAIWIAGILENAEIQFCLYSWICRRYFLHFLWRVFKPKSWTFNVWRNESRIFVMQPGVSLKCSLLRRLQFPLKELSITEESLKTFCVDV